MQSRKKKLNPAFLTILPSFIIVFIFVYVFISYTIRIAISDNWQPAVQDFTVTSPWYENFRQLAVSTRFQSDIRNTVIFTSFFLTLSVGVGFLLAIGVSNMQRSQVFFRNLFLMPYAVSFIVTGVVWRWIFNPLSGANLLLQYSGISDLYERAFGKPLQPGWTTSGETIGNLNSLLEKVIPGGNILGAQMGIPMALLPVIFAASWQLCGFAMSMFLAGLAAIPHELREAAAIDRASGFTYTRRIALPLLMPMAVTSIVILTHTALKIFDLIYAMSGSGIGFATDMPGIFVYETMYKALRYPLGAAASLVMLFLVCIIVIPYLIRNNRQKAEL